MAEVSASQYQPIHLLDRDIRDLLGLARAAATTSEQAARVFLLLPMHMYSRGLGLRHRFVHASSPFGSSTELEVIQKRAPVQQFTRKKRTPPEAARRQKEQEEKEKAAE